MTSITHSPELDSAPRLPELLARAKERMLAEMRTRLEASGYGDIRGTHGCVFRFVPAEGMRLTDLAAHAEITKQSCGEIVDDLEHLGYVERLPDPADRRAKIIRLTERGEEARAAARRAFGEIEAEWANRYGTERMAIMRELLAEIAADAPAAALAA